LFGWSALMGRPSKLTPEQWAAAAREYQTASLEDVAAKYGVHLETIRQGLKVRGVKIRSPYKTVGKTGRKAKYD
jgi:transposase